MSNFRGLAVVMAALLLIDSLLPLGTALQFGGDEGYELMTGFLMSKGYALYHPIWNDQPPVLVLLLAAAFRIWGPSILAARLIAAGFGLLLFTTFYQVTSQRLGQRAAWLATFFLLASPGILEISVSVMQEVPAFALALVSVWLLFQWRNTRQWPWLLASGAMLGVALGIKLTAILVVPALLVEMLWPAHRPRRQSSADCQSAISPAGSRHGHQHCQPSNQPTQPLETKAPGTKLSHSRPAASAVCFPFTKILRPLLYWCAATGLTFAAITLLWGQGSLESSYRAHFAEHPVAGLPRPDDFPLPLSLFVDHAEVVLAAVVGLVLVARHRQWRAFAFPLVLLGTTLTVHLVHRPWWMYYYLHLAIPLAWLAGFAVAAAFQYVSQLLAKTRFNLASTKTWQGLGLAALVALVLVRSESRLEGGIKDLRQRERVAASPLVAQMRAHASGTHWVYVAFGNEIYAFQAGLPMPPKLALVTLKRFWSDQITDAKILEMCRRYKPEQILLKPETVDDDWRDFLGNYTLIYQDKNFNLYLRK